MEAQPYIGGTRKFYLYFCEKLIIARAYQASFLISAMNVLQSAAI